MTDGRTRGRQVNLRERRLTSLEGFPYFEDMHTLFLQDNLLSNFDHLGVQPGCTSITLDRNRICDFTGTSGIQRVLPMFWLIAATALTRIRQHLWIERPPGTLPFEMAGTGSGVWWPARGSGS